MPTKDFNDLLLSLTASKTELMPGDEFLYTLTVTNTSPYNMYGIELFSDYDQGYLQVTDQQEGLDDGDSVYWPSIDLTPGASKQFNFKVKVYRGDIDERVKLENVSYLILRDNTGQEFFKKTAFYDVWVHRGLPRTGLGANLIMLLGLIAIGVIVRNKYHWNFLQKKWGK